MSARFIVADVFDGLATLEDASVDLILSSPPFLAVRSYLPADHPAKHKEIGSEATPADYLDTLLDVVEACARVLAPHGSLVFELGDTYAGSGGAGGDYNADGLRDGQQKFSGSAAKRRANGVGDEYRPARTGRRDWPMDKSLTGIPTLFAWSLAYGRNLLRPERLTEPWRIRNLKPWIRTNPPVGALGDKERPATSYIVVATKARDRWFDLDAVRTPLSDSPGNRYERRRHGHPADHGDQPTLTRDYSAGAPPLDWWCHVDAVLDAELARRRTQPIRDHQPGEWVGAPGRLGPDGGNNRENGRYTGGSETVGATGAHLRRALQQAGILRLEEAIDQSPGGYSGAHYAVWPPELVALLLKEMCPRQVCRECGQPRRRITGEAEYRKPDGRVHEFHTADDFGDMNRNRAQGQLTPPNRRTVTGHDNGNMTAQRSTLGWSDCGHDNWRRGVVCDPFVGSGTTLDVANTQGHYDAIGIDIDSRNADLARQRCGMFLTVEDSPIKATT